jgi:hypothetical protein
MADVGLKIIKVAESSIDLVVGLLSEGVAASNYLGEFLSTVTVYVMAIYLPFVFCLPAKQRTTEALLFFY